MVGVIEFLAMPAVIVIIVLAAAIMATRKGRPQTLWAILSFLFGPALLVLLFLPVKPGHVTVQTSRERIIEKLGIIGVILYFLSILWLIVSLQAIHRIQLRGL